MASGKVGRRADFQAHFGTEVIIRKGRRVVDINHERMINLYTTVTHTIK
jgi:hypothetical protein